VPKTSSVLVRRQVVFVEDAAESILSSDGDVIQSVWFGDRLGELATWSCGMQGAVCSVVVVERCAFAQGVQKVDLVHDEGAVEQFGSAGSDPALHDRVHAGDADPGHDRGNAAVGKNRIERCGVAAVRVSDQVLHGGVGVLGVHDQVPGYLGGPGCGGVCGRAEDADAAGGVLDDGEDGESRSGQGADVNEVGSEEAWAWLRRKVAQVK
jgi:hypothetical protein